MADWLSIKQRADFVGADQHTHPRGAKRSHGISISEQIPLYAAPPQKRRRVNQSEWANISKNGSFGGADQYARARGLKRKHVISELEQIPAYALHQPKRRRFERRQVYVSSPGLSFEMDLADLGRHRSKDNLKQKYVLVMIDKYSRRAWFEPLSGKTGTKVAAGIAKILKRCGCKPQTIHSDYGREFLNTSVAKLLKEWNIRLFHTTTGMKATLAERCIRTLFGKIERYKTHFKTNRFVDKLPHFENLYNNSYHRSIGMTPNQVNEDTEPLVYDRLYESRIPPPYKKAKFRVGDSVLAVKSKRLFDKGYTANYSLNPYIITQVLPVPPQTYYLCKRGNQVDFYYETELVKNVSL